MILIMGKEKMKKELISPETQENNNEVEQFADINEVLKAFDEIQNWLENLDVMYNEIDREEGEIENYELED